ncbi:type-2 ice-structuring protein [Fundulus heteroclitus]|uniref:type-2 ice-structuring protein n=1 Tax=Fundulus heteroclitus TaxID=8078 RepID=UPI00165BE77E|nr:type-2 ice-structuring protein [Fundulus heteroclitus]
MESKQPQKLLHNSSALPSSPYNIRLKLPASSTFKMRALRLSASICALMVLTNALAVPEAKSDDDETAEINLEKRSPYCSSGWTRFNGRCFRYIATPMSWSRAEKNCRSMNANLASVQNIGEYYKIQRLIFMRSNKYTETWIGGSDAQQERLWLWSDGTPFRFTFWCSGKPKNLRTQNCLRMNYRGQRCWADFQCYYLRPSVCAKKAWPILG